MNEPASSGPSGSQPPGPESALDTLGLAGLFVAGDHDALMLRLLRGLEYYSVHQIPRLDEETRRAVSTLISQLLFYLTRPDLKLSHQHLVFLIGFNALITNLVALTPFRTTNTHLHLILADDKIAARAFALLNPYCGQTLDIQGLIAAHPVYAPNWYLTYYRNHWVCLSDPVGARNLRRHMRLRPPAFASIGIDMVTAYAATTYIDPDHEGSVRDSLNRAVHSIAARETPRPRRPGSGEIAILSQFMWEGHAIHKCMAPLLEALAEGRELTLIAFGPDAPTRFPAFFARVHRLHMADYRPDFSVFAAHDYEMLFFPDIGLTTESIVCANTRLAPIQVAGCGHPVGTYHSEIDYRIVGAAVEPDPPNDCDTSERLVVIPGAALAPTERVVRPRPRGPRDPAAPIIVNCIWTAQKINERMLAVLERIAVRARSRLQFRFFIGGLMDCGFPVLQDRLVKRLGVHQQVVALPRIPQPKFLEILGQGDLCIDSFPYGGFTTTIDSLCVGLPFVAWRGPRTYNRTAAYALDRVGLPELIAASEDAYEALVLKLVDEPAYREGIASRIMAMDLDRILFDPTEQASGFRRAIEFILAHHEALKADPDRGPIRLTQ